MKKLIKKWWFWIIATSIGLIICISISIYLESQKNKKVVANIGNGASEFIEGIDNANSFLNEFTYNYETGEVEYQPTITIEKYNSIKEGMTEKEVISILGNGEKLQPEGSNGFLITWGELEIWKPPYYRIQVYFNKSGVVHSKSQMGLD